MAPKSSLQHQSKDVYVCIYKYMYILIISFYWKGEKNMPEHDYEKWIRKF